MHELPYSKLAKGLDGVGVRLRGFKGVNEVTVVFSGLFCQKGHHVSPKV